MDDKKRLIVIAGNKFDYLDYIKKNDLTEEETYYTENLTELMMFTKFYYILGKNWGNYIHVKGSAFCCSFKSRNYRIRLVREWREKCKE